MFLARYLSATEERGLLRYGYVREVSLELLGLTHPEKVLRLQQLRALDTVHTLTIKSLALPRILPIFDSCFCQFVPTLLSLSLCDVSCEDINQLTEFIFRFPHLDDLDQDPGKLQEIPSPESGRIGQFLGLMPALFDPKIRTYEPKSVVRPAPNQDMGGGGPVSGQRTIRTAIWQPKKGIRPTPRAVAKGTRCILYVGSGPWQAGTATPVTTTGSTPLRRKMLRRLKVPLHISPK